MIAVAPIMDVLPWILAVGVLLASLRLLVGVHRMPASERPRALSVDIGPGEILFIPVGWWHHVRGLSLTAGMSFTNFVWPNDFTSFYQTEGEL